METLGGEKTLDLLMNGKVGHIAVIDDDSPYVSPVSYVIVDQKFCFRTGLGRRVEAIRKNPSVSIEVTRTLPDGGWESVIASGEAAETDDQQLREEIVSALLSKYADVIGSPLSHGARNPIPQPATFVTVDLSEISGRSSGSWLAIPTRPGRL